MPHKDPEHRRAVARAYYAKNREKRIAYEKARSSKPERKLQRKKANTKYNDAHPKTPEQRARGGEYARQYRLEHPLSEEQRKQQSIRRGERALITKYGKTSAELVQMLVDQGGVCKLCGSDKSGSKYGWHTDHCHKTDRVRAILCRRCNMALGLFDEDPAFLRRAAIYIEEFAALAVDS